NAALVGTVRDSQQAVIPGAMVTLTNSATGVQMDTKSDETGSYEFPLVRPGDYSLKVEQPGFQSFIMQSLVIVVGQRARVDATLQVGAVSAEVSVEAVATTALQTESAALGDVVQRNKIVEVPLNG